MSSKNPETREKILIATARLLVEHGGKGARMADIAKETGISRQALYLHFKSRTDVLIAATLYVGDQLDVEARLAPSRAATSGVERLRLYIDFWGNFLPLIYGVGKALMMVQDTDEAAATAWADRMEAMRDGCRAAIDALIAEQLVDLVLPAVGDSWASALIGGVERVAAQNSLDLVIIMVRAGESQGRSWVERLVDHRSRGALIAVVQPTASERRLLERARIPFVLIDPA